MKKFNRMLIGVAMAVVAVAVFGNDSVFAAETLTSGLNQLVVVKPGAHERGLPAVRFEPSGESGSMVVDIPPTLHVHRFFYDGDREYQGPIIQGGPTTVVANHPKTGERMYVNVTLPAGAPTIAYSGNSITYVYSDRRVRIRFGSWNTEQVKVDYHSGRGVIRRGRDWVHGITAKSKKAVASSATVQSVTGVACESKDAVAGAKNVLDSTVGKVVDGTSSLIKMIPGVSTLTSYGEQASQAGYESRVRGYSREKQSAALDFIRTNR